MRKINPESHPITAKIPMSNVTVINKVLDNSSQITKRPL